MDENSCPCCGTEWSSAEYTQWIDSVTAPLPDELAGALSTFTQDIPVHSLSEWAAIVRRSTGGTLTVDELCVVPNESPHYGIVDGTRFDFACCVDAIILAVLTEKSVDIWTRSPHGSTIELHASAEGDVTPLPIDTVFSFGVDEDLPRAKPPTLEDAYQAICPYVQAFPDITAYRTWDDAHDIQTIVFSPSTATSLAQELVTHD